MIITNIESLGKKRKLHWYRITVERNNVETQAVYGLNPGHGLFNESGERLDELSFEAASIQHAIHIYELRV